MCCDTRGSAGNTLQVFSEPSARPTLDWANHQAYSLWKDQADAGAAGLEWRDKLIRRKGAPKRDFQKDLLELRTEWANGMTARTIRKHAQNRDLIAGRTLQGEVFVSRLTKDGVEIGIVNWFPENQVLIWDIPGLTKGYIAPEHLKDYGGWPFAPDMAWMNLQVVGVPSLQDRARAERFRREDASAVGRRGRCNSSRRRFRRTSRVATACTGWTAPSYRFCCDIHDVVLQPERLLVQVVVAVLDQLALRLLQRLGHRLFPGGRFEGSLRGVEK